VPAWSSRADGAADFINQRWLDYTGITAEEALGWGWKVVCHPDDLDRTMEYWRLVLASHEDRELEARLRRFDGTYRWFLFRVSLCATNRETSFSGMAHVSILKTENGRRTRFAPASLIFA
jgi:PAS domain S-box-containing protein